MDIMKKRDGNNAQPQIRYSSSLNRKSRKDELQRIAEQNQRIMKTLQNTKPTLSRTKWEQAAKKNRKLMKNM